MEFFWLQIDQRQSTGPNNNYYYTLKGCCNFDLPIEDVDNNQTFRITYRLEIASENLFGRRLMQKHNSKFIHVTPSNLSKFSRCKKLR